MNDLANVLCIGDEFIHRCEHDDLMSFSDQLPDNVLPEIVDVPGGVGDDDDSFHFRYTPLPPKRGKN